MVVRAKRGHWKQTSHANPCVGLHISQTSSQAVTELLLSDCVAVVCGRIKLEERSSLVTSSFTQLACPLHPIASDFNFYTQRKALP